MAPSEDVGPQIHGGIMLPPLLGLVPLAHPFAPTAAAAAKVKAKAARGGGTAIAENELGLVLPEIGGGKRTRHTEPLKEKPRQLNGAAISSAPSSPIPAQRPARRSSPKSDSVLRQQSRVRAVAMTNRHGIAKENQPLPSGSVAPRNWATGSDAEYSMYKAPLVRPGREKPISAGRCRRDRFAEMQAKDDSTRRSLSRDREKSPPKRDRSRERSPAVAERPGHRRAASNSAIPDHETRRTSSGDRTNRTNPAMVY